MQNAKAACNSFIVFDCVFIFFLVQIIV
ncbi:hypothetical protein AFERRI_370074 [Acidithiobacillus ferrivorans]|uniref:Uncharacterized protein n=1 Tax=Acidithiobacillus ferrivorans TaxID=160808 RepID=A0A060UNF8_9PROT|nr:hypothetical protein AFERRI_370074 [Acidithiobacillus ferrivorans]